jgi:hypothetical protein
LTASACVARSINSAEICWIVLRLSVRSSGLIGLLASLAVLDGLLVDFGALAVVNLLGVADKGLWLRPAFGVVDTICC